jgi:predicted GNAT family acetyltransferase
MHEVKLKLNDKRRGSFYIIEGDEQVGYMEVGISGDTLIAYHTEVAAKAEGKGLAKKLLAAMVDHARSHGLKVLPLCPFVYAQFNRHPEDYADIWNKDSDKLAMSREP